MILIKTNFPKLFGAASICLAPFILIRPDSADDKPLVAHEMVHYKEQIKCLTVPWWIAYLCSKKFRMAAEVRAYKVQIALGGLTQDKAAYYLSHIYWLGITQDYAKALLIL